LVVAREAMTDFESVLIATMEDPGATAPLKWSTILHPPFPSPTMQIPLISIL
jgi:hypothetical protein